MNHRRPDSHRRTPAHLGGRRSFGRSTRSVVGAVVMLAMAFASPIHLWLAHHGDHGGDHAAGHGTSAAVELVAGLDHDHHGHHHGGGHGHHHHDHGHESSAETCDSGHDHSGPCQDPVEDCDLCLALSFSTPFLGATVEIPGAFVGVEMAATFEGTTRDIWGPATAASRGPPRRA